MTLDEFTILFASILEETSPENVTPQTRFHDLDEWSSLTALSIIALVDDEFDVALKGADIKNAVTVEDIYNCVKSRM